MSIRLLWQQIPSTVISEILADFCPSGPSGVVLDLEHGVFNLETIYACIQVITLKGKLTFVRVPPGEFTMARYALDAGCHGVIFSTVETTDQAKSIRDLMFFPDSKGKRGLGLVRNNFWGDRGLNLNKPIAVAQIETKKGIENLAKGDLTGFDYYMIGPYDLSLSLNCPGNFNAKIFKDNVRTFEETLKPEQRGFHIVKDFKAQLPLYSNWGFLAFGLDTLMLQEKSREISEL